MDILNKPANKLKLYFIRFCQEMPNIIMLILISILIILVCIFAKKNDIKITSKINNSIEEYKLSGKLSIGLMILEDLKIQKEYGYLQWADSKLLELGDIAFSKKAYELFLYSYKHAKIDPYYSHIKDLTKNYKGKDGYLNNLIAKFEIKNGNIKSGFNRLEIAALNDRRYSNAVKYLLNFYGCKATASIWSELSDNDYTYISSYYPGGQKYPDIPISLKRDEIVSLRIKLRNGSIPKLQPECPIHLFL